MIEDGVRALDQGKNFAALTTLLPGGQPQTRVMWVDILKIASDRQISR